MVTKLSTNVERNCKRVFVMIMVMGKFYNHLCFTYLPLFDEKIQVCLFLPYLIQGMVDSMVLIPLCSSIQSTSPPLRQATFNFCQLESSDAIRCHLVIFRAITSLSQLLPQAISITTFHQGCLDHTFVVLLVVKVSSGIITLVVIQNLLCHHLLPMALLV